MMLSSTEHRVANVLSNCDSISPPPPAAAADEDEDDDDDGLLCECRESSIAANFLTPPTYTHVCTYVWYMCYGYHQLSCQTN